VGIDGDWDVKIRQIGSHNNEELNVYHTSKCFGMCNNVLWTPNEKKDKFISCWGLVENNSNVSILPCSWLGGFVPQHHI
jgi:hypothetical protein